MRIPFDITFHPKWWHKNCGVDFNEDFFGDIRYRLESDVKMRRLLYDKFGNFGLGEKKPEQRPVIGSDLIASGFLHSEIMGCKVIYSDEAPPEVICRKLDEDETLSIRLPDLDRNGIWQKVQSQIDQLLDRFGYIESHINLMGIQNIALDLRGPDLFIDYYETPELAHHLLGVCTEISLDIGKRLKKVSPVVSAGVTAIVKQTVPEAYVTSNCTVDMVSLEIYDDFLLKYDRMLAAEFKPFGIHHCGRTMEHVVEGYKKVEGLGFAEVGAFSDIGSVRKHLPGVHFNARISPVRLIDADLHEIKEDISKIIAEAQPSSLLSVSCVGIDDQVSDEKIEGVLQWMAEKDY